MIITTIRQTEEGEIVGINIKHEPDDAAHNEKCSDNTRITNDKSIARENGNCLECEPAEDDMTRQFIDLAKLYLVEKEPEEVEVIEADSWDILHRYDGKADVVKAKFTCPGCGHENPFAESIPMDDMPAFLMTQISKGVVCGWCGEEYDIIYTSKADKE